METGIGDFKKRNCNRKLGKELHLQMSQKASPREVVITGFKSGLKNQPTTHTKKPLQNFTAGIGS